MKGIYCLIIDVYQKIIQNIGSLGPIEFKKGIYAYVGSAQNNLGKRIKRHFSKDKKHHWHIDYLLANPAVKLNKALYKIAGKEEECRTALSLADVGKPIKGFGCSDCDCYSHLFMIMHVDAVLSKITDLKEVDKNDI